MGLSWTADGAGIVVITYYYDPSTPLALPYYVGTKAGKVTPIVDLSGMPEPNYYYYAPVSSDDYPQGYFYSRGTSTLSPAGDKLLILSSADEFDGISVATLPPTGELPTLVYQTDSIGRGGATAYSSGSPDGQVMMNQMVFTIEK